MITRWAPSPPSGGIGQSGAQSPAIRVTCSTTIRGSPPTMPCTSNRSAPWVPAAKRPMALVTSASSGRRSSGLADLVELDAERPGDHPDLAAPHHARHAGRDHRRLVVHGLAHADDHPHRVGGVVGAVVEDLLAADLVDGACEAAHQHRQQVVAPAGVDAAHEQRGAALAARVLQRVAYVVRRAAVVVERVDRGGDHGGSAAQRRGDVVHRLVGAQLARGHVGDRAGAVERGQGRVGVHRGRDAEAAAEVGERLRRRGRPSQLETTHPASRDPGARPRPGSPPDPCCRCPTRPPGGRVLSGAPGKVERVLVFHSLRVCQSAISR